MKQFTLTTLILVLLTLPCQLLCVQADTFDGDGLFEYFFHEATNQMYQGDLAAAFDILQYCHELNPSSAAVKFELAKFYMLYFKDREAPGLLLREAVSLEPDNYWYWQLLGIFYSETHRYTEAIEIYEKMAAQFPNRIDILADLMNLYDNTGEFRKGLAILDRLELLEGESLQSAVQRFQFYLGLRDMDSAYIVIRPNVEWAIETFSGMVTNIGQLNSIRNLCQRAVRDFPENLNLHYWKALSEYRAGDVSSALSALDSSFRAIKDDSDAIQAARLYTLRGDICYNQKDMVSAFDAYEHALVLNPADNMTANNYAYFLSLERRDLDKALLLSLKTIQEEPLNSTYLDTYAWILFRLGRYKSALEYIDRAVQCEGEQSADVMEHCGDIHYFNGDVEGAMNYWHQAVELHSESKTLEQKIQQRKYIDDAP